MRFSRLIIGDQRMGLFDIISAYATGRTHGDATMILAATAADFIFDDPNIGQIARADFPGYMDRLHHQMDQLRDGPRIGDFMELSEVVVKRDDDPVSVWFWWAFPGTDISGSGLFKVAQSGVVSEKIAYYTPLGASPWPATYPLAAG